MVHPTGFGDALAQVSIPRHCSGLTAVFCHSNPICSSLHSFILLIDHVASHTPLNNSRLFIQALQPFRCSFFPTSSPLSFCHKAVRFGPRTSYAYCPTSSVSLLSPSWLSLWAMQDCLPPTCYLALLSNTFSVPRHSIGLAVLRTRNHLDG